MFAYFVSANTNPSTFFTMIKSATDQLKNEVQFHFPPKRIVSLVPSQTELLYTLGLEEEVVGITKFCRHPEQWFRNKQRIGGTKTVNIEAVRSLQPDLVIANKEENVQEQVEALQSFCPVWLSDIYTVEDALQMISSIGEITDHQSKAGELVSKIKNGFHALTPLNENLRTAYLIWKDPYMAAGASTFINNMLQQCGFTNVFEEQERYPAISTTDLQSANLQLLLLSTEPYPFAQKHVEELQKILPETKILPVDGEMFSWYGSRLVLVPDYFNNLLSRVRTS